MHRGGDAGSDAEKYVPRNGAQGSAAGERAALLLGPVIVAEDAAEAVVVRDAEVGGGPARAPGPAREPEDDAEGVGDDGHEPVVGVRREALDGQKAAEYDERLDDLILGITG